MISENKKKVLELFAEGRKYYKLLKFKEAIKCFEQGMQLDPNDGPSKIYCDRCQHYLKNPPPEDWDGVFVMQTK
jgi:tetratricopeptide (TPR) repeat protein